MQTIAVQKSWNHFIQFKIIEAEKYLTIDLFKFVLNFKLWP